MTAQEQEGVDNVVAESDGTLYMDEVRAIMALLQMPYLPHGVGVEYRRTETDAYKKLEPSMLSEAFRGGVRVILRRDKGATFYGEIPGETEQYASKLPSAKQADGTRIAWIALKTEADKGNHRTARKAGRQGVAMDDAIATGQAFMDELGFEF